MQQHSRGFALHPERKCDWNKDLDDIVKCNRNHNFNIDNYIVIVLTWFPTNAEDTV